MVSLAPWQDACNLYGLREYWRHSAHRGGFLYPADLRPTRTIDLSSQLPGRSERACYREQLSPRRYLSSSGFTGIERLKRDLSWECDLGREWCILANLCCA